ncbi:hypothetical protein CK203_040473 [Vitis vinifera]|uniref:Uncharacterized protein n=1 Tax=Vitis vinifera TaxID=29760 RepID=A0A438I801_VITVI|nr:hypothetical protein CK203_040473 [Vitis vinifera]
MVQRSCTKTNNDVRKQGGGDDEQSPYLKIPHTSEEKEEEMPPAKSSVSGLLLYLEDPPSKSLRLLPFLFQQLKTPLPIPHCPPHPCGSRCLSSRASHHLLSCFSSQQHGFLHQQHGVSCSWSHAWREVPLLLSAAFKIMMPLEHKGLTLQSLESFDLCFWDNSGGFMDFNVSIGLFLMYVVLYYENCLIRLQQLPEVE